MYEVTKLLYYKGRFYRAGEGLDIDEEQAEKLSRRGLIVRKNRTVAKTDDNSQVDIEEPTRKKRKRKKDEG